MLHQEVFQDILSNIQMIFMLNLYLLLKYLRISKLNYNVKQFM